MKIPGVIMQYEPFSKNYENAGRKKFIINNLLGVKPCFLGLVFKKKPVTCLLF